MRNAVKERKTISEGSPESTIGNAEMDFRELLETGRVLWPTYFQLAAMTFAWNASLAAGFSLIFFRQNGPLVKAATVSTIDAANVGMFAIAVIAIVYNLGAMSAYILMNKLHHSLIVALTELPAELSNTKTARLLARYANPSRRKILKHLTHMFFLSLCFFWAIAALSLLMIG